MIRRRAVVALVLSSGLAVVACGRTRTDETDNPVVVTGCLTGSGDRFVLTELERSNTGTTIAAPATETYQLIGKEDDLRPHVGQQVTVTGKADTAQVAIVHESSPAAAAPTGTLGSQGAEPSGQGTTPKVSADSETRVEVARLKVATVRSSGQPCAP
jgi:hypothetical protein